MDRQARPPAILALLIELRNHHRHVLWKIYQNGVTAERHHVKIWLHEIATPPSGVWTRLRHSLNPFIRTFGRLPRPRGAELLSPMHGFPTGGPARQPRHRARPGKSHQA